MKHNAFQSLFLLNEPSRLLNLTTSFSQLFPQITPMPYNVIIKSSEKAGEVVYGQIPNLSLQSEFIARLSKNSLVVSCAEHAELAGTGVFSSTIPAYIWSYYNIDHHHLPLTNCVPLIDPILVIETLQKMLAVHHNKGTVYIHCKSGDTNSAFLAILFKSITDETIKKQLISVQNTSTIEPIIKSIFNKHCPKAYLQKGKVNLGVAVLKHYISFWKGVHKEKQLFEVSMDSKDKFNSYQALSIIAQSDEYKFLWHHAYKNPSIFPVVKCFSEHIYERINQNPLQDHIIDDLILFVIQQLSPENRNVINKLHALYLSYEHLTKYILFYPATVKDKGFILVNSILKSILSYSDKIELLKKSAYFLKNPIKNREQFEHAIQKMIKKPNIMLQAIGGCMMALGIAIILVTLVAGILANGGTLAITFATIGAAAFGAFETGIGKLVYSRGVSDGISKASERLINQIEAETLNLGKSIPLNSGV